MNEVLTFGRRLNACESKTIAGLATGSGGMRGGVVINTRAVTTEAARTARAAVRRVARERPGVSIVVTGCAATLDPAAWAALPGVTRVVPNATKLDPASWDGASVLVALGQSSARTVARPRPGRPGIVIGADLIAGFPTETDAAFERTLAFVSEAALAHVRVRAASAFGLVV